MKSELLQSINAFNCGERSIADLQVDLVDLLKRGVKSNLSPTERKHFDDLFIGYVDMYDEKLLPRSGIIGAVLDLIDQMFRGNYRISLEEVRVATRRFEQELSDQPA